MTDLPAFRADLEALGWSAEWLAIVTGWSPASVRAFRAGARPLPPDLACWVARMAQRLRDDPPPQRAA